MQREVLIDKNGSCDMPFTELGKLHMTSEV